MRNPCICDCIFHTPVPNGKKCCSCGLVTVGDFSPPEPYIPRDLSLETLKSPVQSDKQPCESRALNKQRCHDFLAVHREWIKKELATTRTFQKIWNELSKLQNCPGRVWMAREYRKWIQGGING